MLPDVTPELTDEQIQQIEQARKLIPQLRKQIQRAKLAGINMDAQESALNEQEVSLDKLYRVYAKRITNP